MADPDLNLLLALDALLAEGSVVMAARRLGLSESAMSRTLARLRDATGDPLLVRAGRGLVPTPRAILLRERVHDLADEVRSVLRPAAAVEVARLERTFTLRASESFIEVFAARLVSRVTAEAPGVLLRFAPRPDRDVQALRDGRIDLEIGAHAETAPELKVQALFRDRLVGAVRDGHPLLPGDAVTPDRYAACGHVVTSRSGRARDLADEALDALGLARRVVAVVPSFPAALAIVRASDLVTLASERQVASGIAGVTTFPLPLPMGEVTVTQMWHPRHDADPAHRWLRGQVLAACRGPGDGATDLPSAGGLRGD
ncbi:LysR family transcriptional regulator [Azospirillum picis]|uniref:DNA-binding transcriptional LysR family regulator n=1 Tax=Azospirillum picis TaxID=488438 RepID=A0ABU0MJ71_9PROT|nr:LysR family transcriptional regulator [Azospirillum picis]MBP2299716.1 DNA-binding transcriptional LysR family regulator [Azospirillum picis]MDQ0533512.1 DNA-binding transcriptional LysR family regulator [Azospirillum picis]